MPQVQNWKENALIAVSQQLPEIAKQLRIANELKAMELKIRLQNDWSNSKQEITTVDNIIKGK